MKLQISTYQNPQTGPCPGKGPVLNIKTDRLDLHLGWISDTQYEDGIPWLFENNGGIGPIRWKWQIKPKLLFRIS